MKSQHKNLGKNWLTAGLAFTSLIVANPLLAQVIWKQEIKDQTQNNKILPPITVRSSDKRVSLDPIFWEPVQANKTEKEENTKVIIWESAPKKESSENGLNLNKSVVWEVVPDNITPQSPTHQSSPKKVNNGSPQSSLEVPPPEAITHKTATPPRRAPEIPAPPIQALNRSVAFGDGLVGPDIGWSVPNGFRWSQQWFADTTIQSTSRHTKDGPWRNGNAISTFHANILQTKSWSIGLNTSLSSVGRLGDNSGELTPAGEGIASGFRIAKALNDSAGIAFGGEQILQWDDRTDTGRNFYLMTSKGWWLGNAGASYPLLIANGGIGTGRFANQGIGNWENPLRFACIENVESRSGTFRVDNDLCWSPIGTISLVMNEWWGMFIEYRSGTALAAASINLTGGIPLRLTLGVNFAKENEIQSNDALSWVFRASFGF